MFFLALSVKACPVAETSWPAPAVVWQALSNGAAPIRASRVSATKKFLRTVVILLCVCQCDLAVQPGISAGLGESGRIDTNVAGPPPYL